MHQYAYVLRSIAERVGAAPLRQAALEPGIRAVYRVTVHYDDRRACDAVVTLRRSGIETASVEVLYDGRFGHKPIVRQLTVPAYEQFTTALQKLRFDHLPDQPRLPFFNADLWLIERGMGTFYHSIIAAPQGAEGDYASLLHQIRTTLPEAVREIAP